MSAQASKAAREAAKDIESYLGLQDCTKSIQEMIAKRIDKAVADLLICAINVTHYPESNIGADWKQTFRFLKSALEPWKAGE